MNSPHASLARQAGNALLWRGLGVWGEKLIFLARLLVLARLVAPEDFGLVAIGMTAMAVMAQVTDFGLIPALVQHPAEQKRHLDTAWSISVTRGLAITVILFVAAPLIADLFEEPRATNIIRVLALMTLAHAAASTQLAAVTRALEFRALAMIRLTAAIVNTAVSVYLARAFGAWALVWGAVAGGVAYMLGSYVVAPYRPAFRLWGTAAGKLLRFGRWIFLIGIIGVAGEALLRWLVSKQLGIVELGLFFMAARLGFLPAQTVTELLNEVAFPVYARLQEDPDRIARTFRTMLISVQALLLPVSLVFLTLISGVTEHLLGERWAGTTAIMQLLVLAALLGSPGDCLLPLLKGTGRPYLIVALDVFRLVLLIVVSWAAISRFGLAGVGIGFVVSSIVSQIPVVFVLTTLVKRPFLGLLPSFLGILATGTVSALVAAGVTATITGTMGLIAAAVAAGATALGVGLLCDRVFGFGLFQRLAEPFPRLATVVGQVRQGR